MIFSSFKINENENIYTQIETYIKDSIENGLLQKGSKLPSSRELSLFLNVSRNSVVTAYENLKYEGVIEIIKGKGSFIAIDSSFKSKDCIIDWNSKINAYGKACEELDIIKHELPWEKGMISFKSIAPEESLFDIDEVKRAFMQAISQEGNKLLNYGYAKGYKYLIEYLLKYMEDKGVNISGKDILITSGFTEGLDILISSYMTENDEILCENPTHNTALKIMRAHGVKITGISMDNQGIEINSLKNALERSKPKFIYLTPSYHNPTGIVMGGERRQAVYSLLQQYSVPIIEDGFNEELMYSSSHLPPIASLNTSGNSVIYIGSLSKILFPGIRIGWIFGDKSLINSLESVKRSRNIHTSTIDQALLYYYLKNGDFHKYVNKVKKYYKDKFNFTITTTQKYIPCESISGEGGLHLFIKLKNNINARDVLDIAYRKGVVFTPGDIFYCDDDGKSTFRLGFGRVKNEDIEKGIKIIGESIEELLHNS